MLYRITFLKAPWPYGAVVGDVIDMDHVPAWALGKCEPAGDDAVATIAVTKPGEVPSAGGAEAPDRAALEAEARALGVSFNARTGDETLAARIAEAKAAQQ